MPNLIAGKEVYPELIQYDATPDRILEQALPLLQDDRKRLSVQESLEKVVRELGEPGAAARAAQEIFQGLQ